MKYLDLTLPTPEENLACDEALLDAAEAGEGGEVLRFWQPALHFVVVGYANKVANEVNVPACKDHGVPILRRCSGGGTVLQGPGCLNYALILKMEGNNSLANISAANQFIMGRHRAALDSLLNRHVTVEGHTDLALDGLKFSGNSQRRRKRFLLFHGSFLLSLDLALMETLLPPPSEQPASQARRAERRMTGAIVDQAGSIAKSVVDDGQRRRHRGLCSQDLWSERRLDKSGGARRRKFLVRPAALGANREGH